MRHRFVAGGVDNLQLIFDQIKIDLCMLAKSVVKFHHITLKLNILNS